MAKPSYTETSFMAVSKKPVNIVAKLFRESFQKAPGDPVPLVAESPQRYDTATVFLWGGAIALAILIGFSLAVALSQAMEWSWGVGILFAAGALIGLGLGVNKYYSFGGVEGLGIIIFQSGQNLVALEEPWWFQATEKLRYIFSAAVFNARFVVKNCQTKADGGEAIPVDLVFDNSMSLANKDDAVLVWLRGIAAEAMQSGQDATNILNARLKAMPHQIREILKNVLEPYTTTKTYRGLRQGPPIFDESEAAAVAAGINQGLAALGLPVRFAVNAKVVDIIPPPKVAEQEEREAARLEQEQKLIHELGVKVSAVSRGQTAKLRDEIKAVDIPGEVRQKLQTNLEERRIQLEVSYLEQMISHVTLTTVEIVLTEIKQANLPTEAMRELSAALARKVDLLQEQAEAVHAGKVEERTDDWDVEMDALLALSDPNGRYASKVRQLIERRKAAPDHLEAALLVRRSQATNTKALPPSNPNNGAATKQAADRDPGVEVQVEALAHKAISAARELVSA